MSVADISIIVPVYNVERYLSECIDSLIHQTYQNIDIILVDDGSTDTSGKICDDYQKQDARIRVIHKQNEGLFLARFTGLKLSKAPYIMFCDSDDFVHPQIVEILFNAVKSFDVEYAACNSLKIYKNTTVCEVNIESSKFHLLTKEDLLWKKLPVHAWGCLFAREKVLTSFQEVPVLKTFGEDATVSWNYFHNIEKAVLVPESLYFYRQRKTSIIYTRGGNPERLCNDLITLASYRRRKEWDPNLIGGLIFCDKKKRNELLQKAIEVMGPLSKYSFPKNSRHYWKFLLFRMHCYSLLKILYRIKDAKVKNSKYLYE